MFRIFICKQLALRHFRKNSSEHFGTGPLVALCFAKVEFRLSDFQMTFLFYIIGVTMYSQPCCEHL
jgi:hypothetical protein